MAQSDSRAVLEKLQIYLTAYDDEFHENDHNEQQFVGQQSSVYGFEATICLSQFPIGIIEMISCSCECFALIG